MQNYDPFQVLLLMITVARRKARELGQETISLKLWQLQREVVTLMPKHNTTDT